MDNSDSRASAVPDLLRQAAAIGWRLVVLAGCGWLALRVLAPIRPVVVAMALALVLTALLDPLRRRLVERWHWPRHIAAAVLVVGLIAAVLGLSTVAGNALYTGFQSLETSVVGGLEAMQRWLANSPLGLTGEQLAQVVASAGEWLRSNSGDLAGGALKVGGSALSMSAALLLALFTTFFFLADGRVLWEWFLRLTPFAHRTLVDRATRGGWDAIATYARTQVVVAAVDAMGIGLGAWILGVPLAMPIAVIVFLTAFVPFVGATASGALAVVVALFASGPWVALGMLVVVLIVQQVESNVLLPILMGRAVSMHPWAILLGVSIGTYLAGITGAVFAVPVMAFVNRVGQEVAAARSVPLRVIAAETPHPPWPASGRMPATGPASAAPDSRPDAAPSSSRASGEDSPPDSPPYGARNE